MWFVTDESAGAPRAFSHKLNIPDGWGTWAIVCRPGEGFFYLLHKGGVRKIDYSNPAKVTDTPANDLPAEFREEVKRQLDIHEVSAESQAEIFEKPATPAATPDSKAGANEPTRDHAPLEPKHESAQSLFKNWQASARTDGKIPGGLIGELAAQVDSYIKQYPKDQNAPKLAAVHAKLDASRDWIQAEAVAVLDEIAGIATAPLGWASLPMSFLAVRGVQRGQPLPAELESAAWGQPEENGLRAAWLLEPRAEQYALGSVLKPRVLFHNTGRAPVVFRTETWHQDDTHTARDARGAEIPIHGTSFTGITPLATFRLAPGEYCEARGHGIAIGAGEYEEEHSIGAVGAVIAAKEGNEVTLTHTVDAAQGNDPQDPAELRKTVIAERVEREAPMPRAAADREQLIRRVTLDLTGVAPTAEEVAAFTAEDGPDALAKLIARLQAKPAEAPWSGKLATGETKFRVLAADPNAARAPRTANGPGRYVLGDKVHLQVTQITTDERPHKPSDDPFS